MILISSKNITNETRWKQKHQGITMDICSDEIRRLKLYSIGIERKGKRKNMNFNQFSQEPLKPISYFKEREETQHHQYDNTFSDLLQADMKKRNMDVENKFRNIQQGTKRSTVPFSAQLPYNTTPRARGFSQRMIPESTRVSRVCFNEALENSGPFYLRHWPIWENAPFLPSVGDVSKDPRYGMQTKGFTTAYRQLH